MNSKPWKCKIGIDYFVTKKDRVECKRKGKKISYLDLLHIWYEMQWVCKTFTHVSINEGERGSGVLLNILLIWNIFIAEQPLFTEWRYLVWSKSCKFWKSATKEVLYDNISKKSKIQISVSQISREVLLVQISAS